MQESKRYTRQLLSNATILKERHEDLEETLVRLEVQKDYEATKKYYDNVIAKLTKEMESLPTGFRYTGTFYVKKAYTMPTEYREITGSAYMREDLVSWVVETEKDLKWIYFRAIYKKASDNKDAILTREDAKPVYVEGAG